jgi:hypothetical protein
MPAPVLHSNAPAWRLEHGDQVRDGKNVVATEPARGICRRIGLNPEDLNEWMRVRATARTDEYFIAAPALQCEQIPRSANSDAESPISGVRTPARGDVTP